jgi:hypothetical protein
MARNFVAASSQFMRAASAPLTAKPVTIAAWFRRTAVTGIQAGVYIGDATGNTTRLGLGRTSATMRLMDRGATAAVAADHTSNGLPAVGVWYHGAGVYSSATSRTPYFNGAAGTNNTTNAGAQTSFTRVSVGRMDQSSVQDNFDGDIAEVGVWNVALTASEIASLARGVPPTMVRPNALVFYAPLYGNDSPEPDYTTGHRNLTNGAAGAAATTSTMHAPVIPGFLHLPFAIVAPAPAATGQTVAIGQVTESDTAQAVSRLKARAIGQVSETDTANSLVVPKTIAIGQVTESDTAHAMTTRKSVEVGLVSTTDTAFALASAKAAQVGLVSESDSALTLVRLKSGEIGLVSTTDTAFSVTTLKQMSVGMVTETDSSLALVSLLVGSIGLASETDSAFALTGSKASELGLATETDEALSQVAFGGAADRKDQMLLGVD